MSFKLKICGLKTVDDVKKINDFDIDYVGFVFAKGKRQVDLKTAIKMKEALKSGIKIVGVFADMDIQEVKRISDCIDLDIVQLHSDETDEMCGFVKRSVWKSISIRDEKSLLKINAYKNADGFLLDTYNKEMRGGTGESFHWNLAKGLSEKHFIVLAGGISVLNILEAYEAVKPHVIDLSSSVETDGVKDYKKIEALMRRIKK